MAYILGRGCDFWAVILRNLSCSRMALKAAVTLLPLLGISWVIGFFQFNGDTLVLSYIFVIINGSQVRANATRQKF